MFPPRPGDGPARCGSSSTGRFSQLVDEARAASLEEVRPGDEDRVFYRLSVPKKVIVMLGGPTMNLLIGVVLLTLLVTVHGVATAQPGAVVATVSQCVVPVTKAGDATDLHRPAEDPGARCRHPARRPHRVDRRPAGRRHPRRRRPDPPPRRPAGRHRPRARRRAAHRHRHPDPQRRAGARRRRPAGHERRRHDPDHRGRLPRRALLAAGRLRAAVGHRGARHPVGLRQRYRRRHWCTSPSGWWGCGRRRSAAPSARPTARCRSSAWAGSPARPAAASTTRSSGSRPATRSWFLVGLLAGAQLHALRLQPDPAAAARRRPRRGRPVGGAQAADRQAARPARPRLRRRREGAADRLHGVDGAARCLAAADLRRRRQTGQPRRAERLAGAELGFQPAPRART